ncbi:MAG: coproporphyrinogen dehydrogenase HemZ [Eubacteriales bacterium]|jgi:oxygen-independent coproporphyrinogen-3 oxidase
MLIHLVGFEHDRSTDNLVRAFFPGAEVIPADQRTPDGILTCQMEQSGSLVTFHVEARFPELGESRCDWQAHAQEESERKQKSKQAVYQTLRQLRGDLPWGTLVGVRPTKLLRDLEEKGCSREECGRQFREEYLVSDQKTALALDTYRNEREVLSRVRPDGISAYVSIPFCPTRCRYCSFVSGALDAMRKYIPDYMRCLLREIETRGKAIVQTGRPLQTVYIGGGTPTVLEPHDLRRLLHAVRTHLDFSQVQEFTVECGRPDTITPEKLALLQEFGVDRISINPQTMNDDTLERIGRRHTAEQIRQAFALARSMGFDNINMDLIAGLDGEEPAHFRHTLEEVLALRPENITLHTLAKKKGSDWSNEDKVQKNFTKHAGFSVEQMLSDAYNGFIGQGYEPYYMYRQKNMLGNFENVSYCRDGKFGLYNVVIMQEYHTIVAMGAGGVSKVVLPGIIRRRPNPKYPYEYIGRIEEILSALPAKELSYDL